MAFHKIDTSVRRAPAPDASSATPITNTESIPIRPVAVATCGLFFLSLCFGCGGAQISYGPKSALNTAVTATANPQVALYTVETQKPGSVTIDFGPTTNYGLKTWSRPTPAAGGLVSIYVAGMKANTTYHMQAVVNFSDGTTTKDSDQTFTTGGYSVQTLPTFTTTTASGQTPQPGIEVVNSFTSSLPIVATDLAGNIVWAYQPNFLLDGAAILAPKLLPNGDFIAMVAENSQTVLTTLPPPGQPNMVFEFDLAGNTIKQLTMDQLNSALQTAGYNVHLVVFSHDITVLPNGHWLILADTLKNVVLAGQTTPTQVAGDVIVDVDTNMKPVWVWNEFDHMDVNRDPWMFPDWTHTNAVIYSPDDGNILVSIRHQNWIVKVDYQDGAGDGHIIWHLGAGGDFQLVGGVDPTDWSYAQHGISFAGQYTAGTFDLVVFDNGDDRIYPGHAANASTTCGVNGQPPCYSTVPIYHIDESTMTATLQFHQILPANLYSFFGGNALALANGDIESDACGLSMAKATSQVLEVTNQPNPQPVWNMTVNNSYAYRSYRMSSLYPGVQW
jgi:arylsulfate sulfotransferase